MKDESNILQHVPVTTECSMDGRKRNADHVSVLWNILFRTLTFVMSIELTVQWYYNFMHEQFVTKAFAYTLPFICVVVLLSDLLIDDKETD